jgi:hypothetical protein
MPMPPHRDRPRRRGWMLLAAAAGVAGAAIVAVPLLSSSPARPPSGPATGQQLPSRPRTSSDGQASSRTAGLTVSTAGWSAGTIDGATVPVSPSAGPARTSGGLAAGFTDTPAGSVLAAVNIAVRISGQLGPQVFVPTIGQQVTGPGAAALLTVAWQEYGQASMHALPQVTGGPAGQATATVTSFLLTAWSPSQASVTVTSAANDGSRAQVAIGLSLQWLDGDWQLVAPAGGNFTAAPVPAPVPAGFTPLPGR